MIHHMKQASIASMARLTFNIGKLHAFAQSVHSGDTSLHALLEKHP